jgi:sigma-E factor negative regulatory protein RseC
LENEITHEALVREVDGNFVRVEIVQQAACAACKAKSMCTASETKVKELRALMLEPMEVGERVEVAVEKRLGWKAVLLAFVIPFCLLLGLVALLPRWIGSEAVVGTLAIVSLAPYYLVLRLFKGKLDQEYRFVARRLGQLG